MAYGSTMTVCDNVSKSAQVQQIRKNQTCKLSQNVCPVNTHDVDIPNVAGYKIFHKT